MIGFINTKVKENTLEGEILQWALAAADDYFCTETEANIRDGKKYDKIYHTDKYGFNILAVEEIINDIIYRLDEQLPQMTDSAIKYEIPERHLAAARRVVDKLETIKGNWKDTIRGC